ncbi:MAG TPA: ubiquitin-like small modifier protein 1 [Longimicrobiales bacterium]|nr:ubiquitin-like small modifier protein 1 [Longimicrobiales bacterium]
MGVTVHLPAPLRELAGGRAVVPVDRTVATVGQAFEALREELPAVYERILDERRELRPHVNVFVGREDVRWSGGLGTPLEDGSQVVVLPSVSGG